MLAATLSLGSQSWRSTPECLMGLTIKQVINEVITILIDAAEEK